MTTSERAGCKKPEARIFQHAMAVAGAHNFNSLMVGDDWEVDIQGALNAGMKAVYFAPDPGQSTPDDAPRIHGVHDLLHWL